MELGSVWEEDIGGGFVSRAVEKSPGTDPHHLNVSLMRPETVQGTEQTCFDSKPKWPNVSQSDSVAPASSWFLDNRFDGKRDSFSINYSADLAGMESKD